MFTLYVDGTTGTVFFHEANSVVMVQIRDILVDIVGKNNIRPLVEALGGVSYYRKPPEIPLAMFATFCSNPITVSKDWGEFNGACLKKNSAIAKLRCTMVALMYVEEQKGQISHVTCRNFNVMDQSVFFLLNTDAPIDIENCRKYFNSVIELADVIPLENNGPTFSSSSSSSASSSAPPRSPAFQSSSPRKRNGGGSGNRRRKRSRGESLSPDQSCNDVTSSRLSPNTGEWRQHFESFTFNSNPDPNISHAIIAPGSNLQTADASMSIIIQRAQQYNMKPSSNVSIMSDVYRAEREALRTERERERKWRESACGISLLQTTM